MKKLEEYETPLTDEEERIDNGETWPLFVLARDLERKLAMCREALREIANTQATRTNAGWMIPADIRDDAEETLKATEPK